MSSTTASPTPDPDHAHSTASKRETLTSRAKRIIGRALETPKDDGGGSGTHKGPPKKAPTKRREQVLQAQRTHRQRTQGYIKELEKEVMRLRESENQLQKQNEKYKQNAHVIELYLSQNSLAFPDGYSASTINTEFSPSIQSLDGSLSANYSSTAGHSPNIFSDSEAGPGFWSSSMSSISNVNVDFANLLAQEYKKPTKEEEESFEQVENDVYTPSSSTIPLFPQRSPSVPAPSSNGTGANNLSTDTQTALDFILDLESVCFPHIKQQYLVDPLLPKGVVPDHNFGPQHVYMATTNLLNHQLSQPHSHPHPHPSTATTPTNSSTAATSPAGAAPQSIPPFSMAAPDLDALLKTSLQVDFGADVTPIQIWANLSRLAQKGWVINRETLKPFIQELGKYMRCNGYGAALDKSVAHQAFKYFFNGEEYQDVV